MARTLDDEFYDPVPGYTQTRRRRTETPPPADVPRGGMPVPGPLGPAPSIPDEPRETYADPLSPTRGMRYGLGDERDLSVPVIDPRDPLAHAPATWSGVVPRGSGRAAYSTNGGYAYTNAPAVPDETTPRIPFADAAGEDFEATRRRGARMQAEQDRLGLTTADMDYIRTYGRAAYDARQAKYGQPTTREDYLRQQQGNLAASVAARRAAENELSRIERDNADARRREMWAAEQAGLTDRARIAASVPVVGPGGVAAIPNAAGGWDVSRPEPAPAAPPAPVSFGGGAGAIPEIGADGQPTGRYVYQAPPTPDPNAAPWVPGGGATSVNRVTGDVKTAPGAAPNPNDPKNWKKVGSDIVNVVTNERVSGYDARKALDGQIARLRVARANNALLPDAVAQIDAQIAELEAQKQTLGVADAQAPEAPAATAEPAAQGGASSPSEPSPAPAPAQPAASSSPTGHRRWTPGA